MEKRGFGILSGIWDGDERRFWMLESVLLRNLDFKKDFEVRKG